MEQLANHEILTLEELEKLYILDTLQKCENNKAKAAKALGITAKTLYNKLNRYSADSEQNTQAQE